MGNKQADGSADVFFIIHGKHYIATTTNHGE